MSTIQASRMTTATAFEVSGELATTRPTSRMRIDSIDILRGAVMVLMALDHVRDFFTNAAYDPLDLTQTTTALFLTRWITHFCAPVFVFLAGTSAYRVSRRQTLPEVRRFLWTRGLWLVVLELTVVHFCWFFTPPWQGQVLQVIWAIGVSMLVLAALVGLPAAVIGGFGLLLILTHNAFDAVTPTQFGSLAPLWNVLHVQGQALGVLVWYPLVPWVGVMSAGYAFGAVFDWDTTKRERVMTRLGIGAILLFLVLRLPNLYGDPFPWQPQASPLFSVLAVIKVHKYPPSLAYLLMTLGPSLIVLVAAESWRGRAVTALATIGRVPLFFYVLHILMAHALASTAALALGTSQPSVLDGPSGGWGFDLPVVYLLWVGVVTALYPACHWFAGVKMRRRDWWLSYL